MPLLPYQTVAFRTQVPPEVALARLGDVVTPRRFLRRPGERLPFEGWVNGEIFHISRVINYRNSFLPYLRGRIVAEADGSRVEVRMGMHPVVSLFMLVWCLLAVSFSFSAGWRHEALMPVGMALFAWALCAGAFTYEARRSTRLLEAVVSGRLPSDPPPGA